ncbi:MAG: PASTA domain-containing protein [Ignavibacteria bacterium]|nr:PASTA domain-containing protein [Ignavibacteria bacterium]
MLKKVLIAGGGLVLLFLLFDFVVMPWYVDLGTTQEVPSVTGQPLVEAQGLLTQSGLQPVESETKSDPRAPIGTVVAQNPQAGALVKPGRRIYLTVSGGEQLVEVPSLRGLSLRDARFALERVGLHLGFVGHEISDTFFANTIIDQSIHHGGKTARGSNVHVTVSQGKDPGDRVVPDLTGKTVSEAEKMLAAEGFQVGRVTYQTGMNLVPNTVIDQYPRAGEAAGTTKSVDLFVARLGPSESDSREF